MEGILTWMESSALARAIIENAWAFPALETVHFIGLILLIGSLYVIDLRFLGFAPRIPLDAIIKFIPVYVIDTGISFFFGKICFSD